MRKNRLMKRQKDGVVGMIAVAFLVALVTFLVLLHVEKEALKEYEKAYVWMAAKEVPEGLLCTSESLEEYFVQREVGKDILPKGYISDISPEEGKHVGLNLPEGTILTDALLEGREEYVEKLHTPVIIGVKAEDLSQVASGVLRGGDMVHIYMTSEEAGTRLLWEDVLVQEVFDSAGAHIADEDRQQAASRVNLLVEKSMVEDFYTLLSKGELKVVKAW